VYRYFSRHMKSSIKIIKRKTDDQPQESKPSESKDSVERGTREIVSTVKSWIAELQQKKRAQSHSFSPLHFDVAAEPAQST
jgi:hypothetical protein